MSVNRGPGVRQIGAIGTTPKEHRLALAGQYAENAPGVPRSGVLVQGITNLVTPTASTAPMTYLVGEAATVMARAVGDGVYTPTTAGATIANRTVATANAPATGSRWDLVWIKQNDQEKGDANNDAILGVTSGTAAASPVRPTGTVPAGALILSEHQIFAGAASTTASPNTTTQVWRHTAARGASIPVRNVAERAEITSPFRGQRVTRLDSDGLPEETWDGSVWAPRLIIQIGQGTAPPIFKSLEVSVTLDAYSVAYIVFPEAFPTKLVSTVLMRMHTTGGPVSYNMVADGTSRSAIKFVVNGVPSGTQLYIQYQCWGY
ncbi:hypothetical protein [Arthrobacter sp. GMC3]|uniref:hypothetical protein n=1 Tax=Arthrobacter sp. GMC3 TaxID=2058894 RepID=UPI000CE328CD|nr:hypothetical protein [Arthrobacter sp. GMC3]